MASSGRLVSARVVSNVRTAATRWFTPLSLHLVSLAGAAVFLVWVNRHQWFDLDEWAFLVGRGPHGVVSREPLRAAQRALGHAAHPRLARPLPSAFGAPTYAPQSPPVLRWRHLVTVHLLWRVMVRSHRRRVDAERLCMPVRVPRRGMGEPDLRVPGDVHRTRGTRGWGVLSCCLRAATSFSPRDVVVIALLIVALMCSGAGVTMAFVVAVYVLAPAQPACARRRDRGDPGARSPLVWFAVWGRVPRTATERPDRHVALQKLPGSMIWRGLGAADRRFTGLARRSTRPCCSCCSPGSSLCRSWSDCRPRPRRSPGDGSGRLPASSRSRRCHAPRWSRIGGSRHCVTRTSSSLCSCSRLLGLGSHFRGHAREWKVGVPGGGDGGAARRAVARSSTTMRASGRRSSRSRSIGSWPQPS